ncbi:MAG: anthranilate synthase component I, partial [Phycisphaerales bacterium]
MPSLTREEFTREAQTALQKAAGAIPVLPISVRLLADQLTPVLAYRRLVAPDERRTPSFLFESVEGGDRVGRYSIMGARPSRRIIAKANQLTDIDHTTGERSTRDCPDPMGVLSEATRARTLIRPTKGAALPHCVLGGWFGYAAYDSVRYTEPTRLPFKDAPPDDRNLPDLEFGFYDTIVVFDHAESAVHVVRLVTLDEPTTNKNADPAAAYDAAITELEQTVSLLHRHSKPLPLGRIDRPGPKRDLKSNITRAQHRAMVDKALEYIRAGDIFQVVLGQRFEQPSPADPFDVYRALRSVNPSPYMVYMQTSGAVLVASSPEIL